MKTLMTLALAFFATTAVAEGAHNHGDMETSMGTITRIDTQWNRLTIDHGPLENLDMPSMTMVFKADETLIANMKEGQNIEFVADRVKGKLTVTAMK